MALIDLPPDLLRRIVDLEPELLPLFLQGRLGSRALFEATRAGIYQNLVITDAPLTSFENGKALTVCEARGYAACVHRIVVRPPGLCVYDSPTAKVDDCLQDEVLFDLIGKLPNLQTIQWKADRLPPIELCTILGVSAVSLKHFVFELAERPTRIGRERQRSVAEGAEDQEEEMSFDTVQGPLRWDAPHLASLSTSILTRLSLSGLSATGAQVLSSILLESALPTLKDLELFKTRFVDDSLLRSIATGAKRVERISIREMHGTKLTENGVGAVTAGLMLLRELEIVDVEGRFHQSGWLRFDELPKSLEAIRFAYREERQPHSWSLNHLENIISLLSLSPQRLRRFSISRIVPLPATVPAQHARYPHLATNARTTPKRMTKEQIATIVEDGKSLKELDVDWWSMSFDAFETIVKRCSNLETLKVMLDAPIQKLVSSTAFSNSKLKTLIISVPPEHTPQLASFTAPGASPIFEYKAPPSPGYQRSTSTPPSPATPASASDPRASPIHVRDWRKLLRKASHLREVIWTGRGGLGTWRFDRTGLNAKADFTPILEILPVAAFTEDVIPASPFSSFPSSGPRSSVCLNGSPSPFAGSKRRTQSIAGSSIYSATGAPSDRSRRSSGASTAASSWLGGSNVLGLEGIPGTPAEDARFPDVDVGKDLAEQLVDTELSSSPRKGKGRRASLAKKLSQA